MHPPYLTCSILLHLLQPTRSEMLSHDNSDGDDDKDKDEDDDDDDEIVLMMMEMIVRFAVFYINHTDRRRSKFVCRMESTLNV